MNRRTLHSLLLAVLLLVIGAGTYHWAYAGLYRNLQGLEADLHRRRGDYEDLRGLAARQGPFLDSLRAAEAGMRQRPKIVLAHEDSKITFAYLNELATVDGHHMRVSMVTGQRQARERFHTTSYMLEGEAAFDHLYAFLWKLEHYKRLYTIESLDWQEVTTSEGGDAPPRSLVRFRLAITGYGTGAAWSVDSTLVDTTEPEMLAYNPFLPLARDYIPPNAKQELDVEHAQLQGLSEDRAFILDHRQQLRVLKEGDPVYLGLLTDIDKEGRYAEFALNKGGFIEKVVLRLPARR